MKAQLVTIIDHVKKYGFITNDMAYTKYGIRSLPRRIKDLKEHGYTIKSVKMEGTRCVRYVLA